MARKKAFALLAVLALLTMAAGCGSEAVHTDAQVQEAASEEEESGLEDSDGAGEQETEEAQTEPAEEEEANDAKEADAGAVAQSEIDEQTKNELTAELLLEQEMDTSVMENTRATKGCTFTLPDTFEESEDVPGMYVTKRYPIDASTIYYVALEQDVSLQLMTEDTFKEQAESTFREAYGEDIEITIDSFERIQIEGYPAFRILCHYLVDGIEITQLEYAINADKSYVITYSQTSDYDRMEEYEASAETIRLEY